MFVVKRRPDVTSKVFKHLTRCIPGIPGPVSQSPASSKPTRSLHSPISTLSPLHLRLKPHFPFFHLLRHGLTWYLPLARQEPPRNHFAKANMFREASRSQPLRKSSIREAFPSVYKPLATKKTRPNCEGHSCMTGNYVKRVGRLNLKKLRACRLCGSMSKLATWIQNDQNTTS